MFIKSLQVNMSSTVFGTEERTFFHCSNNSSNKICSEQLLKLQEIFSRKSKVVNGCVAKTRNIL